MPAHVAATADTAQARATVVVTLSSKKGSDAAGSAPCPMHVWDPSRPPLAVPPIADVQRNAVDRVALGALFGQIESKPAYPLLVNLARSADKAARSYEDSSRALAAIWATETISTAAIHDAINALEDAVTAAHRAVEAATRLRGRLRAGDIVVVGEIPPLVKGDVMDTLRRVRSAIEHMYDRVIGWDGPNTLVPAGDRLWAHGWEITYAQLCEVITTCLRFSDAVSQRGADTVNPKVRVVDPVTKQQWGAHEARAHAATRAPT